MRSYAQALSGQWPYSMRSDVRFCAPVIRERVEGPVLAASRADVWVLSQVRPVTREPSHPHDRAPPPARGKRQARLARLAGRPYPRAPFRSAPPPSSLSSPPRRPVVGADWQVMAASVREVTAFVFMVVGAVATVGGTFLSYVEFHSALSTRRSRPAVDSRGVPGRGQTSSSKGTISQEYHRLARGATQPAAGPSSTSAA